MASLTINIYQMKPVAIPLSDDSDIQEYYSSSEQLLTEDYIHIMNNPDRVRKILHFFDRNNDNEEILICLTQFCHNLLLVYKDSIRKYM